MERRREVELKKKLRAYESEKKTRLDLKADRDKKTDGRSIEIKKQQQQEAQKKRELQQKLWVERKEQFKEREAQRKQRAEMLNQKLKALEERKQKEVEDRKRQLETKTQKHRQVLRLKDTRNSS